jgi:hypothetical protein
MIMILLKCLCNRSWCEIKTDVSASFDGGKNYTRNFHPISNRKTVYLKYEISARANGFLSNFLIYRIPFKIEIPKNMNVTLLEYDGNCDPEPKVGQVITDAIEFNVYVRRNKTNRPKIILKCVRYPKTDTLFVFRLKFLGKKLEKYSKTIAVELKDY